MSVINSANVQVGQSVTPANNITLNTDASGNLIINKGVYPTLTEIGRFNNDGSSQQVSVTDFGAVGDGEADDTAAIQAAIASCLVTLQALYFPAGSYYVASGVVIDGTAHP